MLVWYRARDSVYLLSLVKTIPLNQRPHQKAEPGGCLPLHVIPPLWLTLTNIQHPTSNIQHLTLSPSHLSDPLIYSANKSSTWLVRRSHSRILIIFLKKISAKMNFSRPRFRGSRLSRARQRTYGADRPCLALSSEANLEKCSREKRKFVDAEFHLFSLLPKGMI